MTEIVLLDHQYDCVNDFTHKRQAFCGGYGAGKSHAMLSKVLLWASMSPDLMSIVLAPTFSDLQAYTIVDFETMLEDYDIPYEVKYTPFPKYFLYFEDGMHEVRMLSAENHSKLKGFECSAFFFDEFETIKKDIANIIYQKALGRLRQGHGFKFMAFYSTPDRLGFMYDFFYENSISDNPNKDIILYHGNTEANPYVPKDYIDGLYEAYSSNMVDAFIHGRWVNLTGSRVYEQFDEDLNASTRTVKKDDVLHIGIDFNIRVMAATCFVITNGQPKAIDEFHGDRDTAQLINSIKKRYPNHVIHIYPDASGIAEKTNAPSSDISQLILAFGKRNIHHPKANPLVSTRINSVNGMICNGHGKRKLKVNKKTCPKLWKALMHQPVKNGKPDKAFAEDDHADSMGYFIFQKFEIKRPTIKQYG